ncbi:VCBS repeat-containing protein [Cryptosporangium japonicum]|uniref:VCBS repeat-containing protein n=1 Tax=Cryptosporangium japonicum TaxID=80872 RepID=A0ABP3EPM7_9ACTN
MGRRTSSRLWIAAALALAATVFRAEPSAAAWDGFLLQTGTVFRETGDNFDFSLADWNRDGQPDLAAVKKNGTDSGATEVWIANGASNFHNHLLGTAVDLPPTDNTFDFCFADWDRDGWVDLIALKKAATGTHSTEVHVLSGASGFRRFVLQTGTPVHEGADLFEFGTTDWDRDGRPDIVAIKKLQTGTNSTEVHILSAASNYQQFLVQTGTPLHETGENFDFGVADWDADGRGDLFAIKKSQTGTNSTEVHILSGASNFQDWLVKTGTALHETDSIFDFGVADWNRDGRPDVFAVKKSGTGSNRTEVHVLN